MKLKILILLFIFSMLFIPSVFADWILIEQTGIWWECERTHWKRSGWNEGNVTWQTNITNFQGYTLKFRFPKFETWREPWQYLSWMDNDIRIKIDDGVSSLWIMFRFHGQTVMFGLGHSVYLYIAVGENLTQWNELPDNIVLRSVSESSVEIENQLIIGDKKVHFLTFVPDVTGNYVGATKDYNYSFIGKSVTFTLNYHHGGQGYCEYNIIEESWIETTPPEHETPFEKEKSWWSKFWDIAIAPLFSNAGQWLAFVSNFLLIFVNAFKLSFPFLPVIVLFWFLDALITSVQDGNIHPLGNVFMTIYDFIRGLIQTIVNIAETIWSVIKFW